VTNRARQAYVDAVVTNYVRLPGTPLRASRQDRHLARLLYEQRVPLRVVYAAFVLATTRRELRSENLPRLPAIRTLHFFLGAIEEAGQTQLDPAYVQYLAAKISRSSPRRTQPCAPAAITRQISAFPDRR